MNQSFVYALDGKGSGNRIDTIELLKGTLPKGLCWIHLNANDNDAVAWLKEKSKLPELVIDMLLEQGNRPRSFKLYQGLHVILRGVNLNPGADPEDMVAVRIYMTKRFIITATHRAAMSIEDLSRNLQRGTGPESVGGFVAQLSDCLADRMSNIIDSLNDRVDELENLVFKEARRSLRSDLADYRREIISLRRYLSPQSDALKKLYSMPSEFFTEEARMYLHEVSDRTLRYIEDLDVMREKTIVVQEELASFMAEQVEQRTYLLAIVAAIFLPLTFITGLLGINVAGIPYAAHKYAFEVVCAIILVLVILQLLFFRYKKWL